MDVYCAGLTESTVTTLVFTRENGIWQNAVICASFTLWVKLGGCCNFLRCVTFWDYHESWFEWILPESCQLCGENQFKWNIMWKYFKEKWRKNCKDSNHNYSALLDFFKMFTQRNFWMFTKACFKRYLYKPAYKPYIFISYFAVLISTIPRKKTEIPLKEWQYCSNTCGSSETSFRRQKPILLLAAAK